MYRRLTQTQIEQIKIEQQNNRLFINLYDSISEVGLNTDDITPEEIWAEASAQLNTIASASQRIFTVKTLHKTLTHKYIEYISEDSEKLHRTKSAAENTAFLVELVMLYQLTIYKRGWDNHPYLDLCINIYRHISNHSLFNTMLTQITASNDEYEKVFNSEIPEHDYLPQIIKEDSIIKEAVQLSVDCAKYLAVNYTIQWLNNFWSAIIQSKYKEQLIIELQGSQKYTTIYNIIGILLNCGVYNATQTQLANTSNLQKPTKDSIRRYISNGTKDNTTPYAKFVIDYVSQQKV